MSRADGDPDLQIVTVPSLSLVRSDLLAAFQPAQGRHRLR